MSSLTLIIAPPLLAAIALAFVPRNFAVVMRAVGSLVVKLAVDNRRPMLLLIPQCFGTSFIYSPPHTPKGLGRGYFFSAKEASLNVC